MAKVNKWIKIATGHYEFMPDRRFSIKKIDFSKRRDWDDPGDELRGDLWEAWALDKEEGRPYVFETSGTLASLKSVVEMEIEEEVNAQSDLEA